MAKVIKYDIKGKLIKKYDANVEGFVKASVFQLSPNESIIYATQKNKGGDFSVVSKSSNFFNFFERIYTSDKESDADKYYKSRVAKTRKVAKEKNIMKEPLHKLELRV